MSTIAPVISTTSDTTIPNNATTTDYGLYLPPWSLSVPSLLTLVSQHLADDATVDIDKANVPQELRELVQTNRVTAKNIADVAESIIKYGNVGALEDIILVYNQGQSRPEFDDVVRSRLTLKVSKYLGQHGRRGCSVIAAVKTLMANIAYVPAIDGPYTSEILYGAAQSRNREFFDDICGQYQMSEWRSDEALGRADWAEYFWQRHPQPTNRNLASYIHGLVRKGHAQSAIKWIQEHHLRIAESMPLLAYYSLKVGTYTVADTCMEYLPQPFEIFRNFLPISGCYADGSRSMDDLVQYLWYVRSKLINFMTRIPADTATTDTATTDTATTDTATTDTATTDKRLACRRFWVTIIHAARLEIMNRDLSGSRPDVATAFDRYTNAALSVWWDDDTVTDILTKTSFTFGDLEMAAELLVW